MVGYYICLEAGGGGKESKVPTDKAANGSTLPNREGLLINGPPRYGSGLVAM